MNRKEKGGGHRADQEPFAALLSETRRLGESSMLLFDWDDENRAHIAAHDVACAEAEQVINNEPFDIELQTVKGEERFAQLGETNTGRILVVVSTWRDTRIRVITAFDASKAMKQLYIVQKGSYGADSQDS